MLRVEGFQRRIGAFELCIDHWAIERGQYLVLVGPSGAGKTMFLETVAGLHELEAGRIWIDDREVTHLPPEARGIGFVYQDCWLFPLLTVRQNIDFGRRYHKKVNGSSSLRTEELAEMLNISGLLDRKPTTLSGGEKQRVALARALAIQPRLLFLDEPLGTLDPVMRESVAAELQRCHQSFGTTTIHVTHDHTEARMIGDATAVILNGKLELSGPTDEVFRRPRTIELACFLGCENLFKAVAHDGSTPENARVQLGESTFEVKSDVRGKVAICVRPEDVLIEHIEDGPGIGDLDGDSDEMIDFCGSVVDLSNRGAMVRLVIDVNDYHWIVLVSHSQQHRDRFTREDKVKLLIPSGALHLISKE